MGAGAAHAPSPMRSTRQVVLQAIDGLGGIGKTELAIQYARFAKRYPAGVFFASADGCATELSLLQRLATALRLHDLARMTDADELRTRCTVG